MVESSTTYSFEELKLLWTNNGGKAEDAHTAAIIALAESAGNPRALNTQNSNGTIDVGLWQINSVHAGSFGCPDHDRDRDGKILCDNNGKPTLTKFKNHLFDANKNAAAAVKIKKSQGFNAWSSYKHKSAQYQEYLRLHPLPKKN